jgi:hypothetical protein
MELSLLVPFGIGTHAYCSYINIILNLLGTMFLGQLISWFSMNTGAEHLPHIRRTLCSAAILFQNKAQAVWPV